MKGEDTISTKIPRIPHQGKIKNHTFCFAVGSYAANYQTAICV